MTIPLKDMIAKPPRELRLGKSSTPASPSTGRLPCHVSERPSRMDDDETNRRIEPALMSGLDEAAACGKRRPPMGQMMSPRDVLISILVVLAFVAWVWLLIWAF